MYWQMDSTKTYAYHMKNRSAHRATFARMLADRRQARPSISVHANIYEPIIQSAS